MNVLKILIIVTATPGVQIVLVLFPAPVMLVLLEMESLVSVRGHKLLIFHYYVYFFWLILVVKTELLCLGFNY